MLEVLMGKRFFEVGKIEAIIWLIFVDVTWKRFYLHQKTDAKTSKKLNIFVNFIVLNLLPLLYY
jgi:hypothetical protein